MKLLSTVFLLSFSLGLVRAQPASVKDTSSPSQDKADNTVRLFDSATSTFFKVEIESEFPGGSLAWLQFLNSHLSYPNKAIRKRIEGTVVLQFIVDKDGTISDLQAISGDAILQEAALKAMKDSPRWRPAIQDGKRVKSYKKQPIIFKFESK